MIAQQRSARHVVDREFDRFVASESPGLFRAACLLTGDRADAEDLLQSALLRVFRRWRTISGSPKSYAFTVLENLSRDRRRTLRRRPATVDGDEGAVPDAADAVGRVLDRAEVVQAARSLPRVHQTVIACRFLLDLSVGETAAALNLPEGTVKSYTARALSSMRDVLIADPDSGLEVPNA